jgi:hypothetical protein
MGPFDFMNVYVDKWNTLENLQMEKNWRWSKELLVEGDPTIRPNKRWIYLIINNANNFCP